MSSTIAKKHTSFWIPIWLQQTRLCNPDGQPTRALRILFRVENCSWGLLLWAIGLCLFTIGTWPDIDREHCPNVIECNDNCVIEADPDIAGIGMRIAAYTQTICNIFIFGLSSNPGRTSSTYGTLVITSLAVVVTAAIFLWQGALSLHHATIALQLLTITLLPMYILESWRVRSPGIFIAQQVRLFLWWGVSFYVALYMPCFGDNPQCNLCARASTFGIPGRVVNPVNRSFKLAILTFTIFVWLRAQAWVYGPWHLLASLKTPFSQSSHLAWARYVDETQQNLTEWREADIRRLRARIPKIRSIISIWQWYDDATTAREGIKKRQWRNHLANSTDRSWLVRVYSDARLAIRVPRCQRMIVALVISGILIADCESTVSMNLTKSSNDWGYGQIFGLVATLPSVTDLTKLLLRLGREQSSAPVKRAYTV
ncbi:hypothetical protein BDW74DRAFT_177503 [Aspergillus multicolor]|uniref:uncharacterized protein n=1 Tax=Aspergillus multicolor TaxID=41759 RepID=UPI003CCC964A